MGSTTTIRVPLVSEVVAMTRRTLGVIGLVAVFLAMVAVFLSPPWATAAPPRFLTLPVTVSYTIQTYYSLGHPAYDLDPGGSSVDGNVVAASGGTAYVKRTTYWNDPGCSSPQDTTE